MLAIPALLLWLMNYMISINRPSYEFVAIAYPLLCIQRVLKASISQHLGMWRGVTQKREEKAVIQKYFGWRI